MCNIVLKSDFGQESNADVQEWPDLCQIWRTSLKVFEIITFRRRRSDAQPEKIMLPATTVAVTEAQNCEHVHLKKCFSYWYKKQFLNYMKYEQFIWVFSEMKLLKVVLNNTAWKKNITQLTLQKTITAQE